MIVNKTAIKESSSLTKEVSVIGYIDINKNKTEIIITAIIDVINIVSSNPYIIYGKIDINTTTFLLCHQTLSSILN
jgi:hypothetical protein